MDLLLMDLLLVDLLLMDLFGVSFWSLVYVLKCEVDFLFFLSFLNMLVF